MLADEIKRQQIAALDAGETALQSIAPSALVELRADDLELLRPWLAWCKEKSVRHAPAKPHVVAAFIIDQGNVDVLAAIDRLHQKFGLSTPVMTAIVGAAIERVIPIKLPRSWPKEDCALVATLPAQVRHRIETREQERDAGLRRKHNELAELRKQLKQQITTEKEIDSVPLS
jgi:hypothetical protein